MGSTLYLQTKRVRYLLFLLDLNSLINIICIEGLRIIVEVVKEIGSCCAGAGAAVVLLGGLSAAAWPRGWASDVRVGRSVLRRKEHGAA